MRALRELTLPKWDRIGFDAQEQGAEALLLCIERQIRHALERVVIDGLVAEVAGPAIVLD